MQVHADVHHAHRLSERTKKAVRHLYCPPRADEAYSGRLPDRTVPDPSDGVRADILIRRPLSARTFRPSNRTGRGARSRGQIGRPAPGPHIGRTTPARRIDRTDRRACTTPIHRTAERTPHRTAERTLDRTAVRTAGIGRQDRTRCIGCTKTANALGFCFRVYGPPPPPHRTTMIGRAARSGRQIGRQARFGRADGLVRADGSIEGPSGPISSHFSLLNQVAGNSLCGLPGLIYYRGERSYAYCDQSPVGHNKHLTHFIHIFAVFSHGRVTHIIAVFLHRRFLHIFAGFLRKWLIHIIAGLPHGLGYTIDSPRRGILSR